MAPKDSNDCVVTVTIELGHQANFLKEPSPEGFTHDWTVFVRGYEGSRLEYFVEKVVFKLHKTFKSPMRVISEPPFRVTESGYAGFILPIEIHFRNKQTPRKILFSYDLFLNAKDSPPINNVRYEKLKFQNPTPEFKAKLIKAGGTEQGAEQIPYDLFGSPVRSEKKALPKIPKDKDKDKDKDKEKIKSKKSSPHPKSASPTQSLSSLSPMSSDNDDDSYTVPLPPPPPRKEKEPSVKKESSSSSLSQPKQESSSSSSTSSSSSHKEKSKHRSSSSNSSHKERSITDKDATHKPHKHKEKDKDRHSSTSHKDKDGVKKEKSSSSQKIAKDHLEVRKEREGSVSSSNKSTSSSQHDSKINVQMFQKEKERSTHSKDKDISSSSSKEKSSMPGKERDKTSSKEKHSSHKDVSPTTNSETKKSKEDTGKDKTSKEKDRHDKKSHKRPLETPEQEDDAEKKKLKKASSIAGIDHSVKSKSTSGKEKSASRESKERESTKESKEKESTKESKDKTSKSSSTSGKSKQEKSRHSEKHRHSHSSESRPKEPSSKHPEIPQKQEKVSKSDSLTQSERLAMTADFQPQLLLSPLKSKSDEEVSPAPSPVPVQERKLKRSTSNSSPGSQSSHVSCDDANKSDHEIHEPQTEGGKHIVSGLTDSDSDSEDETPYLRSPQKELKSILNKHGQQVPQAHKNSSQKLARRVSLEEKQKKMDYEPSNDSAKKHDTSYKYTKEEKRSVTSGENKSSKTKYAESKVECSDDEVNVEQVSAPDNTNNQGCNGLGILAPNGISIGELIAINEKIEKAQLEENMELIEKVVQVIGETDDFDINDLALSFDICSIEKRVVHQIQAVLREY